MENKGSKIKYSWFDSDFFSKLLSIINKNYQRDEIKQQLKDMVYKEGPNTNGVESDSFAMPLDVPNKILYITYGSDNTACTVSLKIGYYLNFGPRFLWKKIALVRLNQMFNKELESVLKKDFVKHEGINGVNYWDSENTVLKMKKVLDSKKDWIYIYVDYIRKELFPSEQEFMEWVES